MLHSIIYVTLSLSLLSTPISADCPACDPYNSALQACRTKSDVTAVGTPMDSTTIHCMCSSKSNQTDMNACQSCAETDPSVPLLSGVLFAWISTCQAQIKFGDKQAALCWQSQPGNFIPCVSRSDGNSGTGGSTNSGGGGSNTRYVSIGFHVGFVS